MAKRTIRMNDDLAADVSRIAKENNKSENSVVEDALKFYRDYIYMKGKATIISDEILRVQKAGLDLLEQRVNHKTNQVLSELAIQVCILEQIIAGSLQVDPLLLPDYRRRAMEFLRTNNRVFRLDELTE
jgi:predicted transcriptional regulator